MLYRGKRIDNGELVEGFHLVIDGMHLIMPPKAAIRIIGHYDKRGCYGEISQGGLVRTCEIDPATLAMATGQPDKNGTMIFGSVPVEGMGMSKGGDVLNCLTYNGKWETLDITKVIVVFKNGAFLDDDTEENIHDIIIPNPITCESDYFITAKQYEL